MKSGVILHSPAIIGFGGGVMGEQDLRHEVRNIHKVKYNLESGHLQVPLCQCLDAPARCLDWRKDAQGLQRKKVHVHA